MQYRITDEALYTSFPPPPVAKTPQLMHKANSLQL
jgi:hypothetical protein